MWRQTNHSVHIKSATKMPPLRDGIVSHNIYVLLLIKMLPLCDITLWLTFLKGMRKNISKHVIKYEKCFSDKFFNLRVVTVTSL